MDLWKIQLFLVTFLFIFVFNYILWWQDPSLDTGLTEAVDALMKRSKALHFYGLMGKRSGGVQILFFLTNKGEMFVGLMGRSISGNHFIDIQNIKCVNMNTRQLQ
uniref:Uncharacterized protein n=1 Tax=Periophthalmus magnuspinnatus TaxID=409849 RepID=A0A3B3ZKJ6_9GOBI